VLHRAANEDNRVPTFVIVDEAHTLIPEKPRGKPEESLREQFRTIAAEGRKYAAASTQSVSVRKRTRRKTSKRPAKPK